MYALGLYQLEKAKGSQGIHTLTTYSNSGTQNAPAYVVYEAGEELQVSLSISKLLFYGTQRFVGVNDPFAGSGQAPVYVDSRFPVDVIALHVGSNT